jgi:hypothetical protein
MTNLIQNHAKRQSPIQRLIGNSQYVVASALCEAISSLKQGIASTEEHRLATTWLLMRIAGA